MTIYLGNDRCCDKLNNMSSLFPQSTYWNLMKINESTNRAVWTYYTGDTGSTFDFGNQRLDIDPAKQFLYVNMYGTPVGPPVTPGSLYTFTQQIDISGALPVFSWAKTDVWPYTNNGNSTVAMVALASGHLFTAPTPSGMIGNTGKISDKTTGADLTVFNLPQNVVAEDICEDMNGDLYFAQSLYLQKTSSAGTHIWRKQIGFVSGNQFKCVTSRGNAVIAGGVGNVSTASVFSYNLAGTFNWSATNHTGQFRDCVILSNGNVVMVGDSDTQVPGVITYARCYNTSGTEVWNITTPVTPSSVYVYRALCVIADSADNVYIGLQAVAYSGSNLNPRTHIVKYSSSGVLLWEFSYDLGGHLVNKSNFGECGVNGLALDEANGFVYAVSNPRMLV